MSPPSDRHAGGPESSGQDMNETSGPEPASGGPPARRERGWHQLAVSTGSLALPIGLGVLHPVAGEAFAGAELTVILTIIGTALFGSRVLSERAFRLLRWLGNRPEPPQPLPAAGAGLMTTGQEPGA
jgi:hypothetical protein